MTVGEHLREQAKYRAKRVARMTADGNANAPSTNDEPYGLGGGAKPPKRPIFRRPRVSGLQAGPKNQRKYVGYLQKV